MEEAIDTVIMFAEGIGNDTAGFSHGLGCGDLIGGSLFEELAHIL